MGDIADYDIEQGMDMLAAHQGGHCFEDCIYCNQLCRDCKWCDPYTERDTTEYDTAHGWCEKKKKDVWIIGDYECALWRSK